MRCTTLSRTVPLQGVLAGRRRISTSTDSTVRSCTLYGKFEGKIEILTNNNNIMVLIFVVVGASAGTTPDKKD